MKVYVVLLLLILLAACGAEEGPGPPVVSDDAISLVTRYPATVLGDGDGAELCLGGVDDSLPPQCAGPKLVGWDWADVDGDTYEERSGVRWGNYEVAGTWDGADLTPSTITPADQVDPAPYDPPELVAPAVEHTEDELVAIQGELSDNPGFLSSEIRGQIVLILVAYDDGTLQERLDTTYGEGVVVVQSALQPAQ